MRTRLRSLAALLVLLALVVGVPAALAGTVGNPARALGDLMAGDVTDAVLIGVLAAVAWLAWAQFAFAAMVETFSAVRRTPMPRRLPGVLGGQQHLARTLVTAAFLIGPLSSSGVVPPSAYAAVPPAPSPTAAVSVTALPGPAEVGEAVGDDIRPAGSAPADAPAVPVMTVEIHVGHGPRTFWDLAETHLGSGARWAEIWQLNEGRVQPGGAVMSSPHRLLPGWTVLLPAGAAADTTPTASTVPGPSTDLEVTVRAGDTLSELAAERGQPDWRRTWQANAGRTQPDGARFSRPDLIRPGWRITIPDAAAPPTRNGQVPRPERPAAPPPGLLADPPVAPAPPVVLASPGPVAEDPVVGAPDALAGEPAMPRPAEVRAEPSPATARQEAPQELPAVRPMVAFTGGGLLLAGLLLAAVRRHRHRKDRERVLGCVIGTTPPPLAPVEKALLAAGPAGEADVSWLDQALRGLARTVAADPDRRLPDVVAVRITDDVLELVLTGPHPAPPAPWRADEGDERWSVRRGDPLGYDPAQALNHWAPYPALATVGFTAAGEHWLIDLERIGALSLTGDRQRCLDLARFVAAELAHNCWSEQLQVTLAGFGAELAGLNPARVRHCAEVEAATGALLAALTDNLEAAARCGVDVLTGRLRNVAGDVWTPQVLLLAPDAARADGGVERLVEAMRAQRSRTAVALVLTGEPPRGADTRWQLHVDSEGRLTIPALGVELIAQQLPAPEAADLAALIRQVVDGADRPVPPARGTQPWDTYADATGAPLPGLSSPRPDSAAAPVALEPTGRSLGSREPAGAAGQPDAATADSVLPLATATYLAQSATTAADVQTLAPSISVEVRRRVEDADPELDRDLTAWHDPASRRPKLRLLGPVGLTAWGQAPPKRPGFYTEVIAYLVSRAHGATVEQFATDLWPDDPGIVGKTTPRQAASVARAWLGVDERTGQPHLPRAVEGAGGVALYTVTGVLVDAELFRRLRLRGVARGADGIADLQAALDLVTGVPLEQRRTEGYRWLVDTPLEHEYTAMVVDVAHLVATRHLAADAPAMAELAAHTALRAGARDDVALLDLVAACDQAGNTAEADSYVQRILANHSAEVEEDLPPRTYEVLHRRRWLPHGGDRAQAS